MTEIAPIVPKRFDATLRVSRPALTNEQVFRLWRCAIKDDDSLVDELILQVYENIVTFDRKRAECVMELMIRRSAAAGRAFRSLLNDTALNRRTVGVPPFAACPEWFSNMQRLTGSRRMANRAADRDHPFGKCRVGKNSIGELCATFLDNHLSSKDLLTRPGLRRNSEFQKSIILLPNSVCRAVLALPVQGRPLDTLFGLDHDC